MKIYKGNVDITKANQKEWEEKLKDVEKISGYLSVYSDAKLDALKSVGGSLWVNSNVKLDAGKLESVGGYIDIHKTTKVSENIIVLQVAKVL